MQTALSRIWTPVTKTISYDANCYSKHVSYNLNKFLIF